MNNLPIQFDRTQSRKLHDKAIGALRAEHAEYCLTHPTHDPGEAWQEMLRGVYRLVARELGSSMSHQEARGASRPYGPDGPEEPDEWPMGTGVHPGNGER